MTGISWKILKELRQNFLSEERSEGIYWKSRETLAAYDETFAERIRWKWTAVLGECQLREWRPEPGESVLDWGCGTGIAAREFFRFWKPSNTPVFLYDHSSLAVEYSKAKILEENPGTEVERWNGEALGRPFTLLVSHVINELSSDDSGRLMNLMSQATHVIWVEPGTFAASRRLISLREEMKDAFQIIAPCPHKDACGLLSGDNARHWCHHFAKPPREVFHSAFWKEFSVQLGIDLRSLPVSFLVLSKKPHSTVASGPRRVIGRARVYKGYSQALICDASGVNDVKFLARENPELQEVFEEAPFTHFLG